MSLTLSHKLQILGSNKLKEICRQQLLLVLQKRQKVLRKGRKQWEKEKLLVTTNFSFYFYPVFSKELKCRHGKRRACVWERVNSFSFIPYKKKDEPVQFEHACISQNKPCSNNKICVR